eukprot:scaffold227321_cov17-Prasinocladus_malaysianus.AAC.3
MNADVLTTPFPLEIKLVTMEALVANVRLAWPRSNRVNENHGIMAQSHAHRIQLASAKKPSDAQIRQTIVPRNAT